jgi:hypothetical protein
LTIEQFQKLKIPDTVMKDGMIFIWVEKEYISDIIRHLETQGFAYVENVCYVMLDSTMKKEVEQFNTIDATPAFIREDCTFLKKAHKSLLLFRRVSKDGKLELRHQRTGDVVYDWYDPMKPHQKPDFYLYKLIEILLPRAMSGPAKPKKGEPHKLESHPHLKMVELWA